MKMYPASSGFLVALCFDGQRSGLCAKLSNSLISRHPGREVTICIKYAAHAQQEIGHFSVEVTYSLAGT